MTKASWAELLLQRAFLAAGDRVSHRRSGDSERGTRSTCGRDDSFIDASLVANQSQSAMCPDLEDVTMSSFSLECPAMITRGTIVGEAAGVERVEEAGEAVSSSDSDRNVVEGENGGLVIEEDDED